MGITTGAHQTIATRTLLRVFVMCSVIVTAQFVSPSVFADLTAHDYSVELIASVSENPPAISLQWLSDPNAASYTVSRKLLGDPNWIQVSNLRGIASSWKDSDVIPGTVYEYQVTKNTGFGYTGYGYICSAIRRPVVEDRGVMILVVEKDLGAALPGELGRLRQDLIGDGWTIYRIDVSKTDAVTSVKERIRDAWRADPERTKALFLFGHVPVPYSGDISPDLHPDDQGAWPADVYYNDFTGTWTDSTVVRTNSGNVNIPGDGKFDQSVPPGPATLMMGRVDLSNLTCFANKSPARYEIDLARQYLAKDHNFRHGLFDIQRRGLIFDRMYRGLELEPQTCAAWRSFPGFFGRDQVQTLGQNEYFTTLATNSYLWSYVVSGGSVYGSDYIGTSDDWALNEPRVVFTSFLGSYFGEWDKESDFLRAPLGTSGYTLACIFSGQPQWILHPLGTGEPIGAAALLTQNNSPGGLYPPQLNAGAGQVHIALMGDPGLRMHPFRPPGPITGLVNQNGVTLNWAASDDSGVLGYYVYAAASADGPFQRISGSSPITALGFSDPLGDASVHYMVRAVKLEQTSSGSYYNLSQGVFFPESVSSAGVPTAPRGLAISSISAGSVNLSWISASENVRSFSIERRAIPSGAFAKIAEVSATSSSFSDSTLSPGIYGYRVKALGLFGDSDFSGEATVNLMQPAGAIVCSDRLTRGDWIGRYGNQGYLIVDAATNLPPYADLSTRNAVAYVGSWDTGIDEETLLRPDGMSRLFAAWLNQDPSPMVLSFRFSDTLTHRVSIYMVDYKWGIRSGTLDVMDPFTGNVFDSIYFDHFTNGEYITLDLQNYADVLIKPEFQFQFSIFANAIFFDSADAVMAPVILPAGGDFAGKATIEITGPIGASVFYTTDGTDPNSTSFHYGGPFVLTTNALIKAKATKAGYKDSAIVSAGLTNTLSTLVLLSDIDDSTRGDWPGKYGSAGQSIPNWSSVIPTDVEFDASHNQTWSWNTSATEVQALAKNSQDPSRVATAWYDPNECVLDMSVFSTRLRQIALYFLDWDAAGRIEDLIITDMSGSPLLTQRIESFQGGKYVVLTAKGLFQIHVRHVAGPNVALSGIFFGDLSAISNDPPRLDPPELNTASGDYLLRINGQSGQVFNIQSSQDLRTWVVVGQANLSSTTYLWNIPITQMGPKNFYRVIATP